MNATVADPAIHRLSIEWVAMMAGELVLAISTQAFLGPGLTHSGARYL